MDLQSKTNAMRKIRKTIIISLLLSSALILPASAYYVLPEADSCSQQESNIIHPAKSLPETTPWDLVALSEAPDYEWADQDSLVWSLYYTGEPYQGQATRVFAYYASPITIRSKDTPRQVSSSCPGTWWWR